LSCSVIRKKMAGVTQREERYVALWHNRTRRGGRVRKTRKYRK